MTLLVRYNVKRFRSNLLKGDLLRQQDHDAVDLAYSTYDIPKPLTSTKPDSPLIIMHGLMGSKTNFATFSNRLALRIVPSRRVISVDARNHGASPRVTKHNYELMALDVKRLMENLNIRKASLLGHSMGGRALMMFALKWPELVEKLIIEESTPIGSCPNIQDTQIVLHTIKDLYFMRELSLSSARKQADQLLSTLINDQNKRNYILANLYRSINNKIEWKLNLNALIDNFQEILTFPQTMNLQYNGPTLFIIGDNTNTIPILTRKDVRNLFPNAKFHHVPNAGHIIHYEYLDTFLNVVIDFLTDITS